MSRWDFWKKKPQSEAPAPPAGDGAAASAGSDELAFLRGRPDFDAEEMMSVRAPVGASPVYVEEPEHAGYAEWDDAEDVDEFSVFETVEADLTPEDLEIAALAEEAFGPATVDGEGEAYEPGVPLGPLDAPEDGGDLLEALLERGEELGIGLPEEAGASPARHAARPVWAPGSGKSANAGNEDTFDHQP
jgi:hypothetical protein